MAQQIPVLLLVCQPQQGIDVSMLDPTIWTTPPHVYGTRAALLGAFRSSIVPN